MNPFEEATYDQLKRLVAMTEDPWYHGRLNWAYFLNWINGGNTGIQRTEETITLWEEMKESGT